VQRYFAQLGKYDVGAEPLWTTQPAFGHTAASRITAAEVEESLRSLPMVRDKWWFSVPMRASRPRWRKRRAMRRALDHR